MHCGFHYRQKLDSLLTTDVDCRKECEIEEGELKLLPA